MGGVVKSVGKAVGDVLSSPVRTGLAVFSGGLSEVTGFGKRISKTRLGRYADAAAYTAVGAYFGGPAVAAAVGTQQLGSIQAADARKQQARIQAQAEQAAREAEIMRKQALLASQKSMAARQSTAAAVANKLKNTTTSLLGDEEEKLGG